MCSSFYPYNYLCDYSMKITSIDYNEGKNIDVSDIAIGEIIRFKIPKWLAERTGLYYGGGSDLIGIDQGRVCRVKKRAICIDFCEIHELKIRLAC